MPLRRCGERLEKGRVVGSRKESGFNESKTKVEDEGYVFVSTYSIKISARN